PAGSRGRTCDRSPASATSRLFLLKRSQEGSAVEAERRQVTVLFADRAGFTAFSDRAGQEAAFGLMQNLAKLMEDAVRHKAVPFRASLATGSWRCSVRRSRSRTRRCGRVE